VIPVPIVAQAANTTTAAGNMTTLNLIDLITSNPKVAAAVGIQILLGAALGYTMIKVLKYIAAFIGVLVIGAVLNVWSIGGSIEDIIARFGGEASQIKDLMINLIETLGVLTVGPVSLGFVIGILVGLLRSK